MTSRGRMLITANLCRCVQCDCSPLATVALCVQMKNVKEKISAMKKAAVKANGTKLKPERRQAEKKPTTESYGAKLWPRKPHAKEKSVAKPREPREERVVTMKDVGAKWQAHKTALAIPKQRDEAITSANYCSFLSIAIMCWVASILALIGLVWCIYLFLNQQASHDAELKEISLNTMDTLKALKWYTVRCLHSVYNMVIIFIVLVGSFGTAFTLFYKDAINHQKHYRQLENRDHMYKGEIKQTQQMNSGLARRASI